MSTTRKRQDSQTKINITTRTKKKTANNNYKETSDYLIGCIKFYKKQNREKTVDLPNKIYTIMKINLQLSNYVGSRFYSYDGSVQTFVTPHKNNNFAIE